MRNRKQNNENYLNKKRRIAMERRQVPCADCGGVYPWYVMEFDHCRGEKVAHISAMTNQRKWGIGLLIAELEKCDVVCANCHKVRSFKSGCFSIGESLMKISSNGLEPCEGNKAEGESHRERLNEGTRVSPRCDSPILQENELQEVSRNG